MAREVHAREDLMRDAIALTPRLRIVRREGSAPQPAEIVAGFRGDAVSVYFGEDPVYHFNSSGRLRRAFVDGRFVKAEGGRLATLTRRQSPTESTLLRRDLAPQEEAALLTEAKARLEALRAALESGAMEVAEVRPDCPEAALRLRAWLADLGPLQAAEHSRVR